MTPYGTTLAVLARSRMGLVVAQDGLVDWDDEDADD